MLFYYHLGFLPVLSKISIHILYRLLVGGKQEVHFLSRIGPRNKFIIYFAACCALQFPSQSLLQLGGSSCLMRPPFSNCWIYHIKPRNFGRIGFATQFHSTHWSMMRWYIADG